MGHLACVEAGVLHFFSAVVYWTPTMYQVRAGRCAFSLQPHEPQVHSGNAGSGSVSAKHFPGDMERVGFPVQSEHSSNSSQTDVAYEVLPRCWQMVESNIQQFEPVVLQM